MALEIGEERAIELFATRDVVPTVWTPVLEKYLDRAFKATGDKFKTKLQVKEPDNLLRESSR